MADEDTKKVVVPVDKEEDGLDRPFPPPTFDYDTVPDPSQEQADDLPYETQPVVNGVQPVSIEGTRTRFLNNAQRLNKNTPDDTQNLESVSGFTPDRGRLNFPDNSTQDATLRLGDLFGKALPGRRKPNNQVILQDTFKKIDEQTQGDGDVPHQRSVDGFGTATYGGKSNTSDDLTKRVQNSVLSQNRFSVLSDNNPDVFHGADDSNIDNQQFTVFQEALGAYDKTNTPQTLNEMKKVAQALMAASFQSTGQVPNADLTEITSEDFIKKSFRDLRAIKSPTISGDKKGSEGAFNESDSEQTFGSMNSPDVPFDALTPELLSKLALSQIAATIALTTENGALAAMLKNDALKGSDPVGHPYTMGEFSVKRAVPPEESAQSVRNRFGIVRTSNDFQKSVEAGIKEFFGAPFNTSIKDLSKKAVAHVSESPGYYYAFSRAVARSAQDIAARTQSEDITSPPAGPRGADGVLSLLKDSKVIGAINVFASIGDAILKRNAGAYDIDSIRTDGLFGDLPAAASIKSRRTPSDLRLGWRGASTPSMFLLPPAVEFANTFSGQTGMISAAHAGLESRTISKVGKKLTKVQAARHEKRLDAEYVPFYFKDLRTNEIVSFHAFLATLQDQYNASYTNNRTIGRADPIRIYQNTDRSITFTFNLVATSREDFDEMWFKINKLTTLLYPQYTKGRKVTSSDGSQQFIMPFSQVMSASPMIRLRIGDVVRSNYSKFNLSRLFGLGTPDFIPGSGKILSLGSSAFSNIASSAVALQLKALLKANDRIVSFGQAGFDQGAIDLPTVMGAFVKRAKLRPGVNALAGVIPGDVVRVPYPGVRSLPRTNGEGNFELPFKDVYAAITERKNVEGEVKYVARLRGTPDFLSAAGLGNGTERVLGVEVDLDHSQIQVFPEGLVVVKAALIAAKGAVGVLNLGDISSAAAGFQKGSGYADSVGDFLSAKNNSVVKSFEEAGGKGLAGFIDSMNFTWIDGNTNWEVEKDARAPKTAQITMRFLPVHDISPGLDHTGYNRAANYPVGDPSNRIAGTRQLGGAAEIVEAVSDDAMNAIDLVRFAADSNYISDTVELAAERNGNVGGFESAIDVALRNLY